MSRPKEVSAQHRLGRLVGGQVDGTTIRWFAEKLAAAMEVPVEYVFPEGLLPLTPCSNTEENRR